MFLKFSSTVQDMFLLELNGVICCILIRYVITLPSASKNLASICIYYCMNKYIHINITYNINIYIYIYIYIYININDIININPLRASPIKWPNKNGKLPTNCLSVFGHFVNLALKELILTSVTGKTVIKLAWIFPEVDFFSKLKPVNTYLLTGFHMRNKFSSRNVLKKRPFLK